MMSWPRPIKAWSAVAVKKHNFFFVDPAKLTPTGHFGSLIVTVEPISAAKTCTELKKCECFNVRLVSKRSTGFFVWLFFVVVFFFKKSHSFCLK